MTSLQDSRIKEFETELRKRGENEKIDWKESNSLASRGFLFWDFKGVTLTVSPLGLMNIPAVRSYHPPRYPTPIIAAALATELWTKQKARDDANPDLAKSRRTGHLGPIVDPDFRCQNKGCPCNSEGQDDRRRRERGGFNENPNRCS
jgi:hypothetical protein